MSHKDHPRQSFPINVLTKVLFIYIQIISKQLYSDTQENNDSVLL